MKVYIVSTGSYSSYEVRGIYSTIELAKKAQRLYDGKKPEEFALDAMPEHPDGMFGFTVTMDKSGNNAKCVITGVEGIYYKYCKLYQGDGMNYARSFYWKRNICYCGKKFGQGFYRN